MTWKAGIGAVLAEHWASANYNRAAAPVFTLRTAARGFHTEITAGSAQEEEDFTQRAQRSQRSEYTEVENAFPAFFCGSGFQPDVIDAVDRWPGAMMPAEAGATDCDHRQSAEGPADTA